MIFILKRMNTLESKLIELIILNSESLQMSCLFHLLNFNLKDLIVTSCYRNLHNIPFQNFFVVQIALLMKQLGMLMFLFCERVV